MTSTVLIQRDPTTETATSSWIESASTTMRLQVAIHLYSLVLVYILSTPRRNVTVVNCTSVNTAVNFTSVGYTNAHIQ